MIAELGHAALWFAAALALVQLLFAVGTLSRRGGDVAAAVRPVAIVHGLVGAVASACLMLLFVRADLSVALIAGSSHPGEPWFARLAESWGDHSGALLHWAGALGLAGTLFAVVEQRVAERWVATSLGVQAALALAAYAYLLSAVNPFARLSPAPASGFGAAHDVGAAVDSPLLSFGTVGLAIAGSIAMGALVTRDVGPVMARVMRPWVLGAWVLLTSGIVAGSAFGPEVTQLDAAGTAALMPWLAATALIHSLSVLAARGALREWTVILAVIAFAMAMAGVLSSVHRLAPLILCVGGALSLSAHRIGTMRKTATFSLVSREGALMSNNLLLLAVLGVVLFGSAFSIRPPAFEAVAAPLWLMLMPLMAAGPLMRWRRDRAIALLARLRLPIGVAATALLALLLLGGGTIGILPLLGLVAAAGLAAASVAQLWGRNLRRTPLYIWGMVAAHLGVAVGVAGVASVGAFSREVVVAARPGEVIAVGPYRVRFVGIDPVSGPTYTALRAVLIAGRPGDARLHMLTPEVRSFWRPAAETRQSARLTRPGGRLHATLDAQRDDGRWLLRMSWQPFATLISAGGGLIALGGLLALIGRSARGRRADERSAYA